MEDCRTSQTNTRSVRQDQDHWIIAVGLAYASRYKGEKDTVVLTMFGDGARSDKGPTLIEAVTFRMLMHTTADDTVLVMGEDVGINGGVFRVTDGLYEKFGRKRVMDTPIAESAILGAAIGMAMAGLKPVVEMQFSGFSYLMMHQLEGNASRMRTRSRGRWCSNNAKSNLKPFIPIPV